MWVLWIMLRQEHLQLSHFACSFKAFREAIQGLYPENLAELTVAFASVKSVYAIYFWGSLTVMGGFVSLF